jgi:hypothetical protein
MVTMNAAHQPDPISYATVHLALFFGGQDLGVSGTGFVIRTRLGPVLVTALHNLTGREAGGKCKHSEGALPNLVTIKNFFGKLVESVPLCRGDNDPNAHDAVPRFLRHDRAEIDVGLLPLPALAGRHAANALHDSLWRPESYKGGIPTLGAASPCHIIGYPEGLTNELPNGGLLPLWKTGHLANDPDFDFTNEKLGFVAEPLCLVDATTRPGMSGAPVFAIETPGPLSQRRHRLVGIYSGRTSESSDLGLVWKPTVIHEILVRHFQAAW